MSEDMSFTLETVKKGKDLIQFNNFKYRESYSLKCGDIVWKCLGKLCKASIKTNKAKTIIHDTNGEHVGHHPITLRTLTSTPSRLIPHSSPEVAPLVVSPSTPIIDKPESSISGISSPFNQQLEEHSTPLIDSSPGLDLQAENSALKEELAKARLERKMVLDHSIESDIRLMQYTQNIFHHEKTSSNISPFSDKNTQTDLDNSDLTQTHTNQLITDYSMIVTKNEELLGKLESAAKRIRELEDLLSSRSYSCSMCIILKEESKNMISTIRSMEEEIKALTIKSTILEPTCLIPEGHFNRNELPKDTDNSECGTYSDFITVSSRRKNRKRINNSQKKVYDAKSSHLKGENKNKVESCHLNIPFKEKQRSLSKIPVPFRNISITGDSHARGLSTLMAPLVHNTTKVHGICKPGGGLLNIVPTSDLPQKSCLVLMAGSNDVAAGRAYTVFRNLEGILQRCRKSSRVLLFPLPPRYDLPRNDPIHRTTSLVNSFMSDLCNRYEGVDMLDIGAIGRHHFTSHGLHMRTSGKRLLAELIVRTLTTDVPSASPTLSTAPTHFVRPQTTVLEYESFAAAVSGSRSGSQIKSLSQTEPHQLENNDNLSPQAFLELQTRIH